jgi:hypothetical protein
MGSAGAVMRSEFHYLPRFTDFSSHRSVMEIKFATDLFGVLDLAHDRWFNLDQVRFDKAKGEVTFFLGEKRKGPFTDKILKIDGVSDLTIKDDASIGIYDFCDIIPEYSSASIRITSGFPMEIVLKVKQLCVISVVKPEQGNGNV